MEKNHPGKIPQNGNILTSGIIEIWGGILTKIINYCHLEDMVKTHSWEIKTSFISSLQSNTTQGETKLVPLLRCKLKPL
jgi:hypothetical protein